MNTADPFADTDPEDMAVDAVQRQLDAARVSSISLPTSSTLVSNRHPSASGGSDATAGAFSNATGSGQLSTTLECPNPEAQERGYCPADPWRRHHN